MPPQFTFQSLILGSKRGDKKLVYMGLLTHSMSSADPSLLNLHMNCNMYAVYLCCSTAIQKYSSTLFSTVLFYWMPEAQILKYWLKHYCWLVHSTLAQWSNMVSGWLNHLLMISTLHICHAWLWSSIMTPLTPTHNWKLAHIIISGCVILKAIFPNVTGLAAYI